ncbi:MAG: carbohydrate-binding protein [Bacteroidales bacterium]|nr:carbohydrate-binding protein [Bacteroidales bacterium]
MRDIMILFLLGFSAISLLAQRSYTAGEIQSKAEVKYGRFEIMMYSSDVSGTTSTFFLWKNGGETSTTSWNEIDIETFGKSANEWQSNPIWEYNNTDTDIKRWEAVHGGLKIAKSWVKFTLEWTPNYIAWFNNDIEVRRIVKGENVPANHPRYNNGNSDDPVGYISAAMRMCYNHWATYPGEWLGSWNEANLPSYQFVDWFTYQKWNGTGFDAVSTRYDYNSASEITDNYNISTHTFTENQCQFSTKAVGVTNGYMWLGIFKSGQEAAPTGNQIPGGGLPPVVYNHILPKKVEAEEFNTQNGLQTETVVASEGTGLNIGYTDVNDYAEYAIEVPKTGNYTVDFRVASLNGNAGFSVSVDGAVKINEVAVAATGGWQTWATLNKTLALTAGKHTLKITITKAGFNFNWMEFKIATEPPVLSFTNLTNNQTINSGTDLNINVQATHASGIANVQLFVDGILLRQDNVAPYEWGLGTDDASLNTLPVGTHTIKAVATAMGGEVAETSITISILPLKQTIYLQKGWNLISINVMPDTTIVGGRDVACNVSTIFANLDLAEIKTMNSFWKKSQPNFLNSLKTITPGEGYLVNMNTEGTLSITGTPIVATLHTTSLQGWTIVGCPFQTAMPLSSYFNTNNCEIIKNFDGYWSPNGMQNSIQNLEPGKAYFMKF